MKRKYCLVGLFLILAMFLVGCGGVIPPTNQSPTASFTATPTSGVAPLAVSFNASSSSDSDGTIISYAWDFKDGSTGNGQTINHTFSSIGSYSVKLTVTDD
ncbi:MAG: PKD domain-containing protein, partial [Atribacteria sp.]|nr:PKD domain-containing protein [Candidatus Atribacteria bacterium]